MLQFIHLQSGDDRFYLKDKIQIRSDKVRKLKSMKKDDKFDFPFISMLIDCVFTSSEELALDEVKMRFVNGSFYCLPSK